jgi:hypothetical protein
MNPACRGRPISHSFAVMAGSRDKDLAFETLRVTLDDTGNLLSWSSPDREGASRGESPPAVPKIHYIIYLIPESDREECHR